MSKDSLKGVTMQFTLENNRVIDVKGKMDEKSNHLDLDFTEGEPGPVDFPDNTCDELYVFFSTLADMFKQAKEEDIQHGSGDMLVKDAHKHWKEIKEDKNQLAELHNQSQEDLELLFGFYKGVISEMTKEEKRYYIKILLEEEGEL